MNSVVEERDDLNRDNRELQEEIGRKDTRIDELGDVIDDTNTRIEQLSEERDSAFERGKQATRDELAPGIREMQGTNDRLARDLDNCRKRRSSLLTKQEELEASITDLREQLRASEEGVEQWGRNFSNLQETLTTTQTELSRVEASIEGKDEEITRLTQQLQKQRILLGSFPTLKNAAALFWSDGNADTIVGISNAVSDTPVYIDRVTNLAEMVHEDFQDKVYTALSYKAYESARFPTDLFSDLVSDEEFSWMPGLLTAIIALTAASDTLYSAWRMVSRNTLGLLIQAVPSVFYLLMTCKRPQSFTDAKPIATWKVDEEGQIVQITQDFSIRDVLNSLFFNSRFAEVFNSIIPEGIRIERGQLEDDETFSAVVRNSTKWAEFMERSLTMEQFSFLEGMYSTTTSVELLNHLLEGIALSALLERKLDPRREKRRKREEEEPAERPRVRQRRPALPPIREEDEIDIMSSSITAKEDTTWNMWLS
jgi:predicted  nucleic acid-binding Zn-ribbon protein